MAFRNSVPFSFTLDTSVIPLENSNFYIMRGISGVPTEMPKTLTSYNYNSLYSQPAFTNASTVIGTLSQATLNPAIFGPNGVTPGGDQYSNVTATFYFADLGMISSSWVHTLGFLGSTIAVSITSNVAADYTNCITTGTGSAGVEFTAGSGVCLPLINRTIVNKVQVALTGITLVAGQPTAATYEATLNDTVIATGTSWQCVAGTLFSRSIVNAGAIPGVNWYGTTGITLQYS